MASKLFDWRLGAVYYQKRGMGEPLLLVHNIYPGASHDEFEHNLAELSRRFTVYAIDLPGFGQSDAPRHKYTASTYVSLLFDFLHEVVREPAHVMSAGLSCAYVAQVAVWRATLLKKLVFICPRSEPTGLESPRSIAPLRHFVLSNTPLGTGFYETMTGDFELTQFLKGCLYHPREITPELVQRLHDNARQYGAVHPYASLITGYLDSDLLRAMPHVMSPLLLIWGRQAQPAPVEHSVRLASVTRDCRLEVIEQAGAWAHYEQSATVNRLVTSYLLEERPLHAGQRSVCFSL